MKERFYTANPNTNRQRGHRRALGLLRVQWFFYEATTCTECPEWPDQSVLFRSLAPQPHLSLVELLESVGGKKKKRILTICSTQALLASTHYCTWGLSTFSCIHQTSSETCLVYFILSIAQSNWKECSTCSASTCPKCFVCPRWGPMTAHG
jgi:hypothetical protein